MYLFKFKSIKLFKKAINSFKASKNVSIFITGSNSDLLSGELATHIAGRYVSFKTYPFTFKEVCELKKITDKKVIEEAFTQLAEDYLLTKQEAEKIVDKLKEKLTGKTLKDMFASSQRMKFARNLIEPVVEQEVKKRKKIKIPTDVDMSRGLRVVLEELSDQAG